MACGRMILKKKWNFIRKKIHFILLNFFFKCYYCSINPKRQLEHSGIRQDTSSLVPLYTHRKKMNWIKIGMKWELSVLLAQQLAILFGLFLSM